MADQSDGTQNLSDVLNANECHPARRYDYLLGGKDNFAADRESGDRLVVSALTKFPTCSGLTLT
jgi:hypothetical protein